MAVKAEPTSLLLGLDALLEEFDVAIVFKLYCLLNVLGSSYIFDFNSASGNIGSLHRDVYIDTKLPCADVSIGDLQVLQELLHLSDYDLGVLWVRPEGRGHYF